MLRIGILGAAGIAPKAIIDPARRRSDTLIRAVASRRASAATAYAEVHGIERAYGSYADLVADDTVDLVYVALPPSEHAEWSIAALEAGKHVLCEKPSAMNAAEAERVQRVAEARGLRMIEAFHDRYHPLSAAIDDLVASGRLGRITALRADFSASNPFDPASIRHDPAVGGGALMDLGCYPAHWLRALTGEEPEVEGARATLNPLGADMSIETELRFPSGVRAVLTASMASETMNASLDIVGTDGSARIDNLVFPSQGHSITEMVDGLTRQSTVAGASTYDHQLAAVVEALTTGGPLPTEGADVIGNMRLIDSIYRAAGVVRDID